MSSFISMNPHTPRAARVKYVSQWADKIVLNPPSGLSDVSWYEEGYPYSRADERIKAFLDVPDNVIVDFDGEPILDFDGNYLVDF